MVLLFSPWTLYLAVSSKIQPSIVISLLYSSIEAKTIAF